MAKYTDLYKCLSCEFRTQDHRDLGPAFGSLSAHPLSIGTAVIQSAQRISNLSEQKLQVHTHLSHRARFFLLCVSYNDARKSQHNDIVVS
ncbi:hypothetical protein CVT26_000769 [Gymnopilus dilepis]|uniref:Uncharacterized protein n=1 Tax=Gymnopilus dilepis TaxID=231916 RepID=A0A409Y2P1_9AGAR|nr:hypothetical protein CVT26_000769 [Gymnopilus dilepis]